MQINKMGALKLALLEVETILKECPELASYCGMIKILADRHRHDIIRADANWSKEYINTTDFPYVTYSINQFQKRG